MQTVNVRIKTFPGNPPRPATSRVQLPKLTPAQRAQGLVERPLEPGEVVEMPKNMALDFLTHLEHELEMTLNEPTRKLYFNDQFEAERTSENFRPGVQPRSEKVKADIQEQRERMAAQIAAMQEAGEKDDGAQEAAPIDPATVAPDDVAAAMALLKQHGYAVSNEGETISAAPLPEPVLEVDPDDDYVPGPNAILPAEVDEERRKYQEQQAAEAAAKEEKPKRKRRKTATKADDGPPPATKRRRRGANS